MGWIIGIVIIHSQCIATVDDVFTGDVDILSEFIDALSSMAKLFDLEL